MKEITEGEAREALRLLSISGGFGDSYSTLQTLITRHFEMKKVLVKYHEMMPTPEAQQALTGKGEGKCPSGPDDELSILSDQLSLAHIRIKEMEKALKEIKETLPVNPRSPIIWEIKLIVDNALTGKGEE